MEIKEAADKLNISEQSLRCWLRSGHCPFGDAWKGTGRYFQYHIEPERLKLWQEGKDLQRKEKNA